MLVDELLWSWVAGSWNWKEGDIVHNPMLLVMAIGDMVKGMWSMDNIHYRSVLDPGG